jgi:hypothetical protein
MNKLFLPLCATGGAALAAVLSYVIVDRPAASKPMTTPSVMIADVQGAPGDGNTALRAAFSTMLTNAKIPQVDTLEGCTIAVSAEVSTLRLGNSQKVSIVWQVHDANGEPLGEVSQLNKVDYGALDETWGTDASLAARGARDGIFKIMQRPRQCA